MGNGDDHDDDDNAKAKMVVVVEVVVAMHQTHVVGIRGGVDYTRVGSFEIAIQSKGGVIRVGS